jgi:hypothetical protein
MYVRVTHGRFNVDTFYDLQRLVEETLIPLLNQLPGFHGYHGGVNRSAGTLVSFSFWDTEEQTQVLQAQRGPFEALGVEFEPAEIYEIIAQA